jgi:soluble P-type ATPase
MSGTINKAVGVLRCVLERMTSRNWSGAQVSECSCGNGTLTICMSTFISRRETEQRANLLLQTCARSSSRRLRSRRTFKRDERKGWRFCRRRAVHVSARLSLGQPGPVSALQVGKDYCRLIKFGDSLYRCKQLKKAALGRMATIVGAGDLVDERRLSDVGVTADEERAGGRVDRRKTLIVQVGKDYCRLIKFGDSLYRCKQLKKAALGRMVVQNVQEGREERVEVLQEASGSCQRSAQSRPTGSRRNRAAC